MAKKFMFVCLGLLALTVAFLLGAQFGRAEYVDHSTTGIVAVDGNMVLLDNGQAWRFAGGGYNWDRCGACYEPPVPVSQIKFWNGAGAITASNEVWVCESGSCEWRNLGCPPGTVATQPSTWGSIKAQFK